MLVPTGPERATTAEKWQQPKCPRHLHNDRIKKMCTHVQWRVQRSPRHATTQMALGCHAQWNEPVTEAVCAVPLTRRMGKRQVHAPGSGTVLARDERMVGSVAPTSRPRGPWAAPPAATRTLRSAGRTGRPPRGSSRRRTHHLEGGRAGGKRGPARRACGFPGRSLGAVWGQRRRLRAPWAQARGWPRDSLAGERGAGILSPLWGTNAE